MEGSKGIPEGQVSQAKGTAKAESLRQEHTFGILEESQEIRERDRQSPDLGGSCRL